MNPHHRRRIRRKIARSGFNWAMTDFLNHPEDWTAITAADIASTNPPRPGWEL